MRWWIRCLFVRTAPKQLFRPPFQRWLSTSSGAVQGRVALDSAFLFGNFLFDFAKQMADASQARKEAPYFAKKKVDKRKTLAIDGALSIDTKIPLTLFLLSK